MFELLIAFTIGILFWTVHWTTTTAPEVVFGAGLMLIGAGFAFGLPTGFVYHVLLYRSLRRIDALPSLWWLHPTSLHDRIPNTDRGRVLAWCYAGALGFLVIVVGIPIGVTGAWRLG